MECSLSMQPKGREAAVPTAAACAVTARFGLGVSITAS